VGILVLYKSGGVMRKKIEIEETIEGQISGNVHVLDADVFCKNNINCLTESHVRSIRNLEKGKTVKINLPDYNPLVIKLFYN
jgi:hypothetical protein